MSPSGVLMTVAPGGVIGDGRTGANLAIAVVLVGLVAGGLALARSTGRAGTGSRLGTGNGRAGAFVALVAGPVGTALAVLHLATSTGGPGTGNGRAGAVVAMVLGLAGTVLGGAALARRRRASRAG